MNHSQMVQCTLKTLSALLCFAGMAMLHAQDMDRYRPDVEKNSRDGTVKINTDPAPATASDEMILDSLKGLVLMPADTDAVQQTLESEGLIIHKLPILEKKDIQDTLQGYLNKPVSMQDLQSIRLDIIKYYRNQNRPVVDVIIPEQDVTNGVVQMRIMEASLGKITIKGNEHFSTDMLRNYLSFSEGDYVQQGQLHLDNNALNYNPFRSASLSLRKGSEPGTADLEVNVRDQRPWRVYAGYENSGSENVSENRFFAGFNWGNAFKQDGVLSYQYTQGEEFDTINAHSLTYSMLTRDKHEISIFGSYSETEPDANTINIEGESVQVSGRYEMPVLLESGTPINFEFGIDYKNTNNTIEFGGAPLSDDDVDTLQGLVGVNGEFSDSYGVTYASANVFYSPGGLLGSNDTSDFRRFRAQAESEYFYFRGEVDRRTDLQGRFNLQSNAIAQFSTENLLPAEQMNMGGYNTVRGYEENEINGDNGFFISNQLEYGPFSVTNGKFFGQRDLVTAYVFWDYANVWDTNEPTGQDTDAELHSIGPGFRLRLGKHVTARFDWGFQLEDSGQSQTGDDNRAHVGVTVSY